MTDDQNSLNHNCGNKQTIEREEREMFRRGRDRMKRGSGGKGKKRGEQVGREPELLGEPER